MRFRWKCGALLAAGLLVAVGAPASGSPVGAAGARELMATPATSSVVPAATKKPVAMVRATYATLSSGMVRVTVNSNAKKVQVSYRTKTNKKHSVTKKVRAGSAQVILARGTKAIRARGKSTAKLRRSGWVPAVLSEQLPSPTPNPGAGSGVPDPVFIFPVITPQPNPNPTPVTPPTISNLTATVGSTVTLGWQSSSTTPGEARYEVHRKDMASLWGGYSGMAGLIEGLTFVDRTAAPGTAYEYSVWSVIQGGTRGPVVSIQVTIPAAGANLAAAENEVLTMINMAREKGGNCGGVGYDPTNALAPESPLNVAARDRNHSLYMQMVQLPASSVTVAPSQVSAWGNPANPTDAFNTIMSNPSACSAAMSPAITRVGVGALLLPATGNWWTLELR